MHAPPPSSPPLMVTGGRVICWIGLRLNHWPFSTVLFSSVNWISSARSFVFSRDRKQQSAPSALSWRHRGNQPGPKASVFWREEPVQKLGFFPD